MDGMRARIETQAIRVIVTTEDHEIEGYIHIKPGGYQSRVSDLLNMHDLQYIPITDATITTLSQAHQTPRQVKTIIIRLDTIKMVIPVDGDEGLGGGPGGDAGPGGGGPGGGMGGPGGPGTGGGPGGNPAGPGGVPHRGGPWEAIWDRKSG